LRDALQKGLKTAPGWTRVLDASAEWGIPPWEMVPSVPPVIWWERWNAYQSERLVARGSDKDRLMQEAQEEMNG